MKRAVHSKTVLAAVAVATSLLTGCNDPTVFHSYRSVDPGGWKREDTVHFEVPINDTLHHYRMEVLVRHRNRYPFQNIGLTIRGTAPDSSTTVWKTNLKLTDRDGRWKGEGWGDLYQKSFEVGRFPTPRKGVYRIDVASCMSDSLLTGVNDLGIRVWRTEE